MYSPGPCRRSRTTAARALRATPSVSLRRSRAMFVLVFSTRLTLLTGAAVMIVVVLARTALRNRKR